jgi:hypothetical protein
MKVLSDCLCDKRQNQDGKDEGELDKQTATLRLLLTFNCSKKAMRSS